MARPPRLALSSSFQAAYTAGRFTQLGLISQSELEREAKKQGDSVSETLLEQLDREGLFRPIAFSEGYPRHYAGLEWPVDTLVFRDSEPFRPWSRYRYREDGFRRVTALYSPWQLMYLKSALDQRSVSIPYVVLLRRRSRVIDYVDDWRRFVRRQRDLITSLEESWRPTVLLLCWLQDRYLPYVRGRTVLVHDPKTFKAVDPTARERRTFKPKKLLADLSIAASDVEAAYKQLALVAQARDPIEDWYLVVRAAPHRAREKFGGDARIAHLIYDGAEILRRFLADTTGTVPPDCNVVFRWPTNYMETWLGHERRVYYDRDDFKKILERRGLTPHGVHVFVEGTSDVELIGGLIDALWGNHRELGVRFTHLDGLGEISRQRTLFDGFSTYARKALLVADAEGKAQRDLRRLRKDGLLIGEDEFHSWKRNIEEDSATLGELIGFARRIAARKGKTRLGLTQTKLKAIMQANGGKKGAAQEIIDYAKQRGIYITKVEMARLLRDRIVEELEPLNDEDDIMALSERRTVLGLALGIGRYSGSR